LPKPKLNSVPVVSTKPVLRERGESGIRNSDPVKTRGYFYSRCTGKVIGATGDYDAIGLYIETALHYALPLIKIGLRLSIVKF